MRGELLRVYWFDAARDRVPTIDQRVVARAWVKLRLGNLNKHNQQKGVDAQIREDLETLARHGAVTDAILIAGDKDMVPAVEAAQTYGVRIHLWGVEPPYGTNQAERLIWESDTVDVVDAASSSPTSPGHLAAEAPSGRPGPRASPTPLTAPARPRRHAGRTRACPTGPIPPVTQAAHCRASARAAHMEEIGEHVAHKWILTRGADNIRDLLPGPILPTVIDKEL